MSVPRSKNRGSDVLRSPVCSSEHFLDHLSRLDDLDRSSHVALVLVARIDAERLTEGAEQVRDRDRPLDDLDAALVGSAEDASSLDAGAGQPGVERRRIMLAAGTEIDLRRP